MMTETISNPVIRFGLNSEECELLLAFEQARSLSELSELLHKDASNISRRLQSMSQKAPVLHKVNGKWSLTDLGKQLNTWTRNCIETQKQILGQTKTLTIASTREFAARVLSPNLKEIIGDENVILHIITAEAGVEKLLLSGDADIGIDCGQPDDPLIRFHRVVTEPFSVVATPQFLRKHKVKEPETLFSAPNLQYKRLNSSKLLQLSSNVPNVYAIFNDLACIREACLAGLGWSILPTYAVKTELEKKKLKSIDFWQIPDENFGVWYVRGRKSIQPWVEHLREWLAQVDLSYNI